MNLIPGTRVAVRRGNNFFEGTVTRTEIVDGEVYVLGEWARKLPASRYEAPYKTFRAHEDDVRLWMEPSAGRP
jgi:hypothetical protein